MVPFISPETPAQNDVTVGSPSDELISVDEFHVSASSGGGGEYSGMVGKVSANSILKYGLYLVGLFAFQTICAVWVLGSTNSNAKGSNLSGLDMGVSEKRKGKFLLSKNEGFLNEKVDSKLRNAIGLDEHDLEEKIKEIRTMAREARKIEEKELRDGNREDDTVDEILDSKDRIGIEKEIGARLVNLEKRLHSKRGKLQGLDTKYLDKGGGEDGDRMDNLNGKEDDKTLIFKKKFKFKSPAMNSRSAVKGFPGREGKNKQTDLAGIDQVQRRENVSQDGDLLEGVSRNMEMDSAKKGPGRDLKVSSTDGRKLGKKSRKIEAADPDMRLGTVQESSRGMSSEEAPKSRIINGKSKDREVSNQSPADKVGNKKSDAETNLWWLNLPYVLAILMRRGLEHEEPGGLFTLRVHSHAQDQNESSYTITFEDRIDANNFCYLLESFFEDLTDFSADIVPLSTKDLHQAVKSDSKKVIVIRKRQLKLYAGQPFEDVEMALHSLIENETAYT